jgi:hypothetical protein
MLAQEQRPPESGDGGGERRGDAPGSPCVRHRKPAPPEHASVCKAPERPFVVSAEHCIAPLFLPWTTVDLMTASDRCDQSCARWARVAASNLRAARRGSGAGLAVRRLQKTEGGV